VRWRSRTLTPDRAAERAERRRRRVERARLVARAPARVARAPARLARAPARAARRAARAPVLARPARALRDVVAYWRAERRTLRQGYAALAVSSLGDLLAGVGLGAMSGRLEELPSLLILVPAAVGMRGNIFGAMGSRLGTAVHAGLVRLTRSRRTVLAQNVYASVLLSVTTSAFLAVGARAVSAAVGLSSISIWDFLVISVIGGVASGLVILGVTVGLAAWSVRRGWDLDNVVAPVVTFVGDTVTMPALLAASLLAQQGWITVGVGAATGLATLACLVAALRTRQPLARRILRESIVVLALAGLVDLVAGSVLEHRAERLLALPALLVLVPPFLEDAGNLGIIVGARLSSKLHLGVIRPRLIPERLAFLDISLVAAWALSVFTLLGVSGELVARLLGLPSPGLVGMVGLSLLAGYLAAVGAALVAYAGAVASFRFGLDPDNHTVPLVTSTLDLIGVICLVGTAVLLGIR
jgi:mgtE-like transporter